MLISQPTYEPTIRHPVLIVKALL